MKDSKIRKLVLLAMFSALIIIMTVVPYLGYINYGGIEITTLHIPVILGAVFLGWKYGALLGGVWGVTCLIRAYTNPLWIAAGFGNPLIAVLPRILVGVVAGLCIALLLKLKVNKYVGVTVTSVIGTVTNTVLVLTALYIRSIFVEMSSVMTLFNNIWSALITINGIIELVAAAIIIPSIYAVLSKYYKYQ